MQDSLLAIGSIDYHILERRLIFLPAGHYQSQCTQVIVLTLSTSRLASQILFGLPFSQDRYDSVIFACALDKDTDEMDDGDQTQIGSRGGMRALDQQSAMSSHIDSHVVGRTEGSYEVVPPQAPLISCF